MTFAKAFEPTIAEVSGVEVKLLFTLRAAARLEDEFETDYMSVIYRTVGLDPRTGEKAKSTLSAVEQATLVAILAKEGGTELSMEDLMALPMTEFTILAKAAVEEIINKSTPNAKKKEAATKRTGK